MPSFRDHENRLWEVRIRIAELRRVKSLCGGLDLTKLIDDNLKGLGELIADPCRFVDVLYVVCKDQADALGITDEQFGGAFGGDTLERAVNAFVEALFDFFPNPTVRKSLTLLVAKSRAVAEQYLSAAGQLLESVTEDQILKPELQRLKGLLTPPPESSASTQNP